MATARVRTTRESYDFGGVATLGLPAGPQAAAKLADLYGELTEAGAGSAAKHLRAVDDQVRHLPFPVVERLVAPERVLAELDEVYRKPVRRLGILRNQAALLPLLVTWLSLAIATYYYQQQINNDPGLVTRPFMLLWEHRFGGRFVPTFSEIALLDFALILGIVGLTLQLHRRETEATTKHDRAAHALDEAMILLAVAVERDAARAPKSAEQWADAAQKIILDAIRQTKELSAANQQIVDNAAAAVEAANKNGAELIRRLTAEATTTLGSLQATNQKVLDNAAAAVEAAQKNGEEFIKGLAGETRTLLSSLQADNRQFIDRAVREATTVLREAITADRALVNDQMAPLVAQFRTSVEEFKKSHGVYQASTSTFVGLVSDLGAATNVLGAATKALGDSAKSQVDVAGSIERHLKTMEKAQSDFVDRVKDTAESIGAAATAMGGVGTLLRDSLHSDLQKITANLSVSSGQLAAVDAHLAGTTHVLAGVAHDLQRAATSLDRAASPRRRWSRRASP